MRNLLVFLVKRYFFLLFLFLESISLYFLVQKNFFQHATAVSAANRLTGSLFKVKTDLLEYLDLKEQNKILAEKLALTFDHDSTSWLMYTSRTTPVNDTMYRQRFEYLYALVIDNTVTERNNYIILDRGRLQGVKPDMGVVCASGIVGIVREVSDNYCMVMSVLHKDSHISASVKKDGTFGQLSWDGLNYRVATLTDLPTHSKIALGDTLITSGLGDAFPEGIVVGTVKHFEKKAGDKTYTVDVELSTDFRKLRHVFVVENLMRDELDSLKLKMVK
ncbi:MAG TPA: rod shape-determining protein MreC [Bacteroidia bacterium]|jgi:rod shape-determining protein MreC|nr:rod shape-determining protein MreC [Bacteroidia bacterium]